MKRAIFLLLILSNVAAAQKSSLYGNNRRLLIDSSYKIDDYAYRNIENIEEIILPRIYNHIKYPEVARENNVSGTVIVRLSVDGNSKDFNFEIVKADEDVFRKPVLEFFKNMSSFNWDQLRPTKGAVIFYLPIKFSIMPDRFKEMLKKNHSVAIETSPIAAETITTN